MMEALWHSGVKEYTLIYEIPVGIDSSQTIRDFEEIFLQFFTVRERIYRVGSELFLTIIPFQGPFRDPFDMKSLLLSLK